MRHVSWFPVILVHDDGMEERTMVKLVVTDQHFEDDIPRRTCTQCKRMAVFFDMTVLKADADGENLTLSPVDTCIHCVRREYTRIRLKKRMPVRLEPVRGVDGSGLRWFEQKKRRWKRVDALQFRFMSKTQRPLTLALQPYDDRHHAHDGTPYEEA